MSLGTAIVEMLHTPFGAGVVAFLCGVVTGWYLRGE